jgi:hypothetical protein
VDSVTEHRIKAVSFSFANGWKNDHSRVALKRRPTELKIKSVGRFLIRWTIFNLKLAVRISVFSLSENLE